MIINWRHLYLAYQSNTGMIDVRVGGGLSVRLLRRVPVDDVGVKVTDITPKGAIIGIEAIAPPVEFVRKSTYTIRLIIHPNGGNAMQMVCDACGAAYPFNWSMMKFTPCGFCAVRRQSGVRVQFGKWSWEKLIEV
jgi:hypothetical protein